MRGRWAGWLAFMGWRQRLWWIVLRGLLPWPLGHWERPTECVRTWAAEGWTDAYMRWKAAGYKPERWPRGRDDVRARRHD